eukprot:scaffold33047_cov61-Attheya_sp.AAC.4
MHRVDVRVVLVLLPSLVVVVLPFAPYATVPWKYSCAGHLHHKLDHCQIWKRHSEILDWERGVLHLLLSPHPVLQVVQYYE